MMSTAASLTPKAAIATGVPLVYRLALDLACAHLYAAHTPEEPLLLVASAPAFAYEGLLRAGARTALLPENSATAAAMANMLAHALASTPASSVAELPLAGPAPLPGVYPLVLWATPLRTTWRERLPAIHAAMPSGGTLAIVAPGLLERMRAPWRGGYTVGPPPAAARLGRELEAMGYTSMQRVRLGSLNTLLWAARARLALALGQPDQADRCEAGYRASLAPASGKGPSLCALLLARKGAAP